MAKTETRGRKLGVEIMGGKFYRGVQAARRGMILGALRKHKGNVTAAAEDLGITRAYLYLLARNLAVPLPGR